MHLLFYSKFVFKKAGSFFDFLNKFKEAKETLNVDETTDVRASAEIRTILAKKIRESTIAKKQLNTLASKIVQENNLEVSAEGNATLLKALITKVSAEQMTTVKQKAFLALIEKDPKTSKDSLLLYSATAQSPKILAFLSQSGYSSVRSSVYLNQSLSKKTAKIMALTERDVNVLQIMSAVNKNPIELAKNKASNTDVLRVVVSTNPGNPDVLISAIKHKKATSDVVLLASTMATTTKTMSAIIASPKVTKDSLLVLSGKSNPVVLEKLSSSTYVSVRKAVAENTSTTFSTKISLARDKSPAVLRTLANNISGTDTSGRSVDVLAEIGRNKNADDKLLVSIIQKSNHPDVLIAVINNPNVSEETQLACVELAKQSGDEDKVLIELAKSKYPKVRFAIIQTGRISEALFKKIFLKLPYEVQKEIAASTDKEIRMRVAKITKDEGILEKYARDDEEVQLIVANREGALSALAEERLATATKRVRVSLAQRPRIHSNEAKHELVRDTDPDVLVTFIQHNESTENLREVAENYKGISPEVVNALAEEARKRKSVRLQQDLVDNDKTYLSLEAMMSLTDMHDLETRANFSKKVCKRFEKAKLEKDKIVTSNKEIVSLEGNLLRYSLILRKLGNDSSRLVNREPKKLIKENVEIFAKNA